MASKRKRSGIWDFFVEDNGTSSAICNICQSKIKRGEDENRAAWSPTPLWNHLKRHHLPEYETAIAHREKEEEEAKRRKSHDEQRKSICQNT